MGHIDLYFREGRVFREKVNFKCDNDDDSLDSYRSKRGSFGGEYASGTENDGEQSVDDDGGGRK